jgi:hypothetical protein
MGSFQRRSSIVLSTLLVALVAFPPGIWAQSTARTTFSGSASALRVSVLGQSLSFAESGPLLPQGGADEAAFLEVNNALGVASAEVLHSSTIGQGDRSRSEASVANLSLTINGNTITAGFLMSRATAVCSGDGAASVSGGSELVDLVINGQAMPLVVAPNTTVDLPNGGKVVLNEQGSQVFNRSGDISVTALHVIIPGTADVRVASASADVNCAGRSCTGGDFVTGGGRITTPSGSKANFGVAGGIRNGAFWGHLVYIDHANTGPKVKGTEVTAYFGEGNTRVIQGKAEVNGKDGHTYEVRVTDNGEPGRNDTFSITVSLSGSVVYAASGPLEGGNIQLHRPCK